LLARILLQANRRILRKFARKKSTLSQRKQSLSVVVHLVRVPQGEEQVLRVHGKKRHLKINRHLEVNLQRR
jgi:hypothetical protein